MGSLSQLEVRLCSLEEQERVERALRDSRAAAADVITVGVASPLVAHYHQHHHTLPSPPTIPAKSAFVTHPYALLPSSTVSRLSTTAVTVSAEASARNAMVSNRDLARRVLVTDGKDAATGPLEDDDDDAFQAALLRARGRTSVAVVSTPAAVLSVPIGVKDDDGLSNFLQGMASRFAETDAAIARNQAILRV